MEEGKGVVKHVLLTKFKDIKGYANLVNLIPPMKSFHCSRIIVDGDIQVFKNIDHIGPPPPLYFNVGLAKEGLRKVCGKETWEGVRLRDEYYNMRMKHIEL